jgi:guanylate kinase
MMFIISGPSGSGKTTLLKNLIRAKEFKGKLKKSVSFTTRPKRPGEREGKDYFFISEKQFQQHLKRKKILERTRYLGYHYATPKEFVEKQLATNKHIALCLDLNGALKLKRLYPKDTLTIFVMPPSLKELKARIEKRKCRTKRQEITQRIKLAKKELRLAQRYDYHILNKDLKLALKGIVFHGIGKYTPAEYR